MLSVIILMDQDLYKLLHSLQLQGLRIAMGFSALGMHGLFAKHEQKCKQPS